ncbi:MAG: hypothetical protein AAFO69_15265, partial [Bacteroidota bacterium]
LLVVVSQSFAYANNPDVISKAKKAVASSPDDWYVLASSADVCLEQHANITEAKQWIQKSLEMEENAYTLEVMGDYYLESKQPVKAMEYYVLSLKKAREDQVELNPENQQAKIVKAKQLEKTSD